MGYLKPDSIPAAQEVHAQEACQIIASRCRGAHNKKSYVISCKGLNENAAALPFFSGQKFGRG
jgi:hypothetical protein